MKALGVLTLSLALVACNPSGKKNDVGSEAGAGAAALAPSQASSEPSSGSASLATPAWPAGSNQELKLTWAVYPPRGTGEGETRNLELVARVGDVVRRMPLGAQGGSLPPTWQSVCAPALKHSNVVSTIKFHAMGGPTTFVARRIEPGVLEIASTREVDDGRPNQTHGTISIPVDARIVDAISDIPAAGKEAPFECSPSAGAAKDDGAAASGDELVIDATAKSSPSCSWMPGGKNPSGRAEGGCEFSLSNIQAKPALPAGKLLREELTLTDAPAKVVSPALVKSFGRCKVTASLHPLMKDVLSLSVAEPGCASGFLLDEKFASGVELTTQAKRGAKTVPVRFKVQPAKK